MNCCNCPWKNPVPVEYEVFEADGLIGIEPERGTEESSGMDVFIPKGFVEKYGHYYNDSNEEKECKITSGTSVLLPLNLKLKIPKGFDAEVKNKSGIAVKMKLIKGAQLIDNDYTGNIMINLFNLGASQKIYDGMKIAQIVIRPVLINEWKRVEKIERDTERGEGGFGSTGDRK